LLANGKQGNLLPAASEPIIAPSARKHGVDDEDILHGYANPVRFYDVDEDMVMVIGPDRSAQMVEVGVVEGDLAPVIVHVMKAQRKFLR
jgi:hypothetical protein